jgi:hypothetical protein
VEVDLAEELPANTVAVKRHALDECYRRNMLRDFAIWLISVLLATVRGVKGEIYALAQRAEFLLAGFSCGGRQSLARASSEPPLTIKTFFVSKISTGIFHIEVWKYAMNVRAHRLARFRGSKDAENWNWWSHCSGRDDRQRGIKLGGKGPIPIDIVQPHAENHSWASFCDEVGVATPQRAQEDVS